MGSERVASRPRRLPTGFTTIKRFFAKGMPPLTAAGIGRVLPYAIGIRLLRVERRAHRENSRGSTPHEVGLDVSLPRP